MAGRLSDRHAIKKALRRASLNTVCEEARCPNMGECFREKTATFLILGDVCTRRCGFCAIRKGQPRPVDPEEPERVARAVRDLGLAHAVITSVTRDDLADGGAGVFAACIRAVGEACPDTTVEVLVPDFGGSREAVGTVLDAAPRVLNHNVETIERLYGRVRPGADLERSLEILGAAAGRGGCLVKSGLMVGLGETDQEVVELLGRLRGAGCQVVTIGQYLQPGRDRLPVAREVDAPAFGKYRQAGEDLGLTVVAGAMVRSSYHAREILVESRGRGV
jgi:lipoic acid synthetase